MQEQASPRVSMAVSTRHQPPLIKRKHILIPCLLDLPIDSKSRMSISSKTRSGRARNFRKFEGVFIIPDPRPRNKRTTNTRSEILNWWPSLRCQIRETVSEREQERDRSCARHRLQTGRYSNPIWVSSCKASWRKDKRNSC